MQLKKTLSTTPWFVGIGLLAVVLRLLNIGFESLWMDEIYALMVGNVHPYPATITGIPQSISTWYQQYLAWQPMNWGTLMELLKINVHVPLFYLFLNPWLGWFGVSVESLRGFAAFWSVLMLLPIGWLAVAMTQQKKEIALKNWYQQPLFWVLLLVACNPFMLKFAQEGRMYTLALFWSAISGLCLWQSLHKKTKKPWWILGYSLSILLGMFSHYTFLYQLIFHGGYTVFVFFNTQNKKAQLSSYIGLMLCWLLLGLALFGWFPIYQAQQSNLTEEWHFSKGAMPFFRSIQMLVWEPMILMAGDNGLARIFYIPLTALCLITAFIPFLLNVIPAQAGIHSKEKPITLLKLSRKIYTTFLTMDSRLRGNDNLNPCNQWPFLFCWIILPLLAQMGADAIKDTHTVTIFRYGMLIAPSVYLLCGLAISQWFSVSNFITSSPLNSVLGVVETITKNIAPHPQANWQTRFFSLLLKSKPAVPFLAWGLAGLIILIGVGTVWQPSPLRYNDKYPIHLMSAEIAKHWQPGDLIVVNGPLATPNCVVFYLKDRLPKAPLLHWVKTYQHQQNIPLPNANQYNAFKRVWFVYYRGEGERGREDIQTQLAQSFPKTTDFPKPLKMVLYERRTP